jgi:hypothetical protein
VIRIIFADARQLPLRDLAGQDDKLIGQIGT